VLEDGLELTIGGGATAALKMFGFEVDAQQATHFYYKLSADKRVSKEETPEYGACCKEKGTCGYGFVSALLHAEGVYETLAESAAPGAIAIPVAGGADGFAKGSFLHARHVVGYAAATVSLTDPKAAWTNSVLGDTASQGAAQTESSVPDAMKAWFDAEKIEIVPKFDGAKDTYVFRDWSHELSESEFVRRYHQLTGASDLDAMNRSSANVDAIAGILLVAGAAVAGALAIANWQSGPDCAQTSYGSICSQNQNTTSNPSAIALSLGASFAGTAGGYLIYRGFTDTDTDHDISIGDAKRYVSRYNHALLRRALRPAEGKPAEGRTEHQPERPEASRHLRILPVYSPRFTGLVGYF
jgi:hypothetical protein